GTIRYQVTSASAAAWRYFTYSLLARKYRHFEPPSLRCALVRHRPFERTQLDFQEAQRHRIPPLKLAAGSLPCTLQLDDLRRIVRVVKDGNRGGLLAGRSRSKLQGELALLIWEELRGAGRCTRLGKPEFLRAGHGNRKCCRVPEGDRRSVVSRIAERQRQELGIADRHFLEI